MAAYELRRRCSCSTVELLPGSRGDRSRTDGLARIRRVCPGGWGTPSSNGGSSGHRTRDLRTAGAARSLLRYRPMCWDGCVRVARAAFSLAGSHQDSNLAPTRLQRVALPNELCVRPCGWGTPHPLEPLAGLEPAATCLQDRCTSA